jgi:hypothetical protein
LEGIPAIRIRERGADNIPTVACLQSAKPKRMISAAILSRRLEISQPTLAKHVRRRLVIPDFESDCGVFFGPARFPELRKTIAANRERNWRHFSAAT